MKKTEPEAGCALARPDELRLPGRSGHRVRGQGKRPDVDSLAALAAWSGLSTDDYVRSDEARPEPEPLAKITTYLRSDKNLSTEAARALDELIKVTYNRLRSEG